MPVSWKAEVQADDFSHTWVSNGLRFATREEAQAYVDDLASRWIAARKTRIVESSDPVTHGYAEGNLVTVAPEELK